MNRRNDTSVRDQQLIKSLREHLLDETKTRQVAQSFIDSALKECGDDDPGFLRVMEVWLHGISDQAIGLIVANAGSPIERIFFNALLLGLIKWDALGFQFHGRSDNAPAGMLHYRARHEEMRRIYENYRRVTGDETGKDFPAAVDRQVAAGRIPKEAADELVSFIMVVYQLNLWNAMHYALQPRFPGFGRNGRTITSDLLVWIPGKRNLKIVVECDGFSFHSTCEAFTADRRRDRMFQRHGYRVLRYSGHEIHADPIELSFELFDALHAIAGPKKYNALNASAS